MRVTVVVACRNEARSLAACLDALAAQDHPDFEVLVVDGRSTDGSAELVQSRGVRLVEDPGRGPAAARNVGIRAARSEIVAFTDADCVPRFDWLTELERPFHAPSVAGVAGALRLPRETRLGRLEDNDARVNYAGFITSNVAYRRDVLLAIDGFDEALLCAEDYDLAWRVIEAGHEIARAPAAVVLHDPPELAGGLGSYLAKQFWYGRNDVPAHARALARAWRARGATQGSRAALAGFADALSKAAWPAGALAAAVARRPGGVAAALGGAYVASARHVMRAARDAGDEAREIPALAAIEAAKRVARGAGTLAGLADLARPGRWSPIRRAAAPGPARGSLPSPRPRAA